MSDRDLLLAYNLNTDYKLGGYPSVHIFCIEDLDSDSDTDYYTNKKTKLVKSLNIRKKNATKYNK